MSATHPPYGAEDQATAPASARPVHEITHALITSETKLFEQCCIRHGLKVAPLLSARERHQMTAAVWTSFISVEFDELREILSEDELDLVDDVEEFASRSIAEGTDDTYRSAWRQFVFWCFLNARDPFKASHLHVVAFCAWIVTARDADGKMLRDDAGRPMRGTVAPTTLDVHLAAIAKVQLAAGREPITGTARVKDTVTGIRNRLGMTPRNQKKPITFDLLTHLLILIDLEPTETRNRALAVPWALGFTATFISEVDWDAFTFADEAVTIHGPGGPVVCDHSLAVRALRDWRYLGGIGPFAAGGFRKDKADATPDATTTLAEMFSGVPMPDLFSSAQVAVPTPTAAPRSTGKPLSRPGVAKAIRSHVASRGLEVAEGSACPAVADYDDDEIVGLWEAPPRTLVQVRDRALLLSAWFSSLRGENVVETCWAVLESETDRVIWDVGASKTNQSADPKKGKVIWILERSEEPDLVPCPVDAIETWRDAAEGLVRRLTGAQPDDDIDEVMATTPVFFAINKHGHVRVRFADGAFGHVAIDALDPDPKRAPGETPVAFAPMRDSGFNEFIKRLVARAGHDPANYGGHSTRAGIITEIYANGGTDAEASELSGHTSHHVRTYNRPELTRNDNPSRNLMRHLAQKATAA